MRAAALAVALSACAPAHLVWLGRTPDRLAPARVVERGGVQWVEVAGARGAPADAIGVEGLALTASSVAYPALTGGRWRIVHDGRELPGAWDAVGEVRLSTNGRHLAFSAEERGAWFVVVDRGRSAPFSAVVRGSLGVTDEGRASFVARRADGVWVVDGAATAGPFRAVRGLRRGRQTAFIAVQNDGEHAALGGALSEAFDEIYEWVDGGFIARKGPRSVVVVHGRRVHDGATAGALSISGDRFAYVVDAPDGERLVVDGCEQRLPFAAVLATAIAPGRVAYVARRGEDDVVVVDGAETGAWARATPPLFSPDGARWAYVGSMGAGAVLVTDRGRKAFDVVLADTLEFDARGRLGAVVGYASNRSIWIAVDGAPRARVDLEEWAAEAMRQAQPDARAWVRAELARSP